MHTIMQSLVLKMRRQQQKTQSNWFLSWKSSI